MREYPTSKIVLEQLKALLIESLPAQFGITGSALWIRDDASASFIPLSAGSLPLGLDHPLARHFQQEDRPILYPEHAESLPPAIQTFLDENGAALCIPLKIGQSLLGVYVLGLRASKADYSQEDVGILATLAQQSALLLDHVQRYREIEAHSWQLEEQARRRAQELETAYDSMAEQRNVLDMAMNNIADALVVTDPTGNILLVNPAFDRLASDTPRPLEGLPLTHVVPVPELAPIIMGALGTPGLTYATNITLADERIFRVSVCGFGFEGGRTPGMVAVFRDVTQDIELDRIKTNFVAMVSHELRTPLSAVLGFAEMLKETIYGPLSEAQSEAVGRIIANGYRLLAVVNDLLDMTRIEAGSLSLTMSVFSLEDLVNDVIAAMIDRAETKGLGLSSTIDDDVPIQMIGDPQRLNQILVNLVGNALKFTSQGEVNLRIYRPDADHWAMAVSDTGPGIPTEAQDLIFEPFRRLDDSSTREHPGVGLGLSIVRQLATLMGGDVAVASTVGQGSTFTVTLPIRQEASS